jgi:hypothetical protein
VGRAFKEIFFRRWSLPEWPQTDDENGEDETFPSQPALRASGIASASNI